MNTHNPFRTEERICFCIEAICLSPAYVIIFILFRIEKWLNRHNPVERNVHNPKDNPFGGE